VTTDFVILRVGRRWSSSERSQVIDTNVNFVDLAKVSDETFD
jgi:hypothetical protein